jgi:hypothetical protein
MNKSESINKLWLYNLFKNESHQILDIINQIDFKQIDFKHIQTSNDIKSTI